MTSALLVQATLFIFGIRPPEWKIMLGLFSKKNNKHLVIQNLSNFSTGNMWSPFIRTELLPFYMVTTTSTSVWGYPQSLSPSFFLSWCLPFLLVSCNVAIFSMLWSLWLWLSLESFWALHCCAISGKNNVQVVLSDWPDPLPGYLSLHQVCHRLSLSFTVPVISLSLFWHLVTSQVCDKVTLKWTPNSLMDGRQGEEEVRIAILSLGMMMGKVDSVNDYWHGWFWFELLTFLCFPSAPGRWRMLAASCCHIHQVNSLLALPPGVLTLLSRSDKNDIKVC